MMAIMGESGSGKTTLLNTLAHQKPKSMKMSGDIKINGKIVDIRPIAAYVEQSDIFIPTLTVYEHLMFTGTLVLRNKLPHEKVRKKVEEILTEFSLDSCRNTRIGSIEKGTGISGGERRRLAIASQIIASPKIIFLDEPTTGLDSHTAETVIKILKRLSEKNCAMVATIHQPSSQIFKYFDRFE
ncbi:Protein white [Thelohanellus kitauei]|uniref:Protein white n=1 Tax=Thelohanellus kitauei TaxID=669202 RepID=A0A0C2MKP2_THEKT|nr:Protein white [Thelohanellus kitauei]